MHKKKEAQTHALMHAHGASNGVKTLSIAAIDLDPLVMSAVYLALFA